jgi:hypothetical protein
MSDPQYLLDHTSFRGLQGRVAKSLGVSKSMVSQVARGKKHSQRIKDALLSEAKKIAPVKSVKPRIKFRIFLQFPNGDVKATGSFPFCGLATIGRRSAS